MFYFPACLLGAFNRKECLMRDIEEQQIALDCLRLAHKPHASASTNVDRAAAYLAFVTGQDEDGARAKLDAVRIAVDLPRSTPTDQAA